ncbi:probable ATP-dependent RNA helicase DHX34 [Diaphorina citri]|uniref:Probable ATP-dependent RNA helicase DHX34 n=1 Tax=Diaphorina citri TaxID=121845 RepID=A0A3Q0JLQ5_DIACI|nr:probable ATP-dependent RNA helicase DHX34 [Diaphorina citri]
MSPALYEEWKLLLRTYLDFKQKEKFSTLMKIRETQNSLPVAQYKQEIIDTVLKERVVIIAGDTGCGKSTQIPQYLVQAGFQRIVSFHQDNKGIYSIGFQGAIDSKERVTSLGRFLSDLPVDIPLGKMLVFGSMFHQIDTVLSLAAVLSVQSPFTNRAFRDPDCETARKELESNHGDPLTVLNAYKEWLGVKKDRVRSKKWCKRRGIEEQRFYEVTKLRSQFKQVLGVSCWRLHMLQSSSWSQLYDILLT